MESDDLRHVVPRKRSRSPSISEGPQNPHQINPSMEQNVPSYLSRQPKRQRKNKEIPAYDAPLGDNELAQMGKSNPLGRKNLKKDAKRARKAHRVKADPSHGGMEVDDDGLEFSFMA